MNDPKLEQNDSLVMADTAVLYMFCIECLLLILAEVGHQQHQRHPWHRLNTLPLTLHPHFTLRYVTLHLQGSHPSRYFVGDTWSEGSWDARARWNCFDFVIS